MRPERYEAQLSTSANKALMSARFRRGGSFSSGEHEPRPRSAAYRWSLRGANSMRGANRRLSCNAANGHQHYNPRLGSPAAERAFTSSVALQSEKASNQRYAANGQRAPDYRSSGPHWEKRKHFDSRGSGSSTRDKHFEKVRDSVEDEAVVEKVVSVPRVRIEDKMVYNDFYVDEIVEVEVPITKEVPNIVEVKMDRIVEKRIDSEVIYKVPDAYLETLSGKVVLPRLEPVYEDCYYDVVVPNFIPVPVYDCLLKSLDEGDVEKLGIEVLLKKQEKLLDKLRTDGFDALVLNTGADSIDLLEMRDLTWSYSSYKHSLTKLQAETSPLYPTENILASLTKGGSTPAIPGVQRSKKKVNTDSHPRVVIAPPMKVNTDSHPRVVIAPPMKVNTDSQPRVVMQPPIPIDLEQVLLDAS